MGPVIPNPCGAKAKVPPLNNRKFRPLSCAFCFDYKVFSYLGDESIWSQRRLQSLDDNRIPAKFCFN